MERIKAEFDRAYDNGELPDARPSYKSWKKKYRKMRIKFDQQSQNIETLHKLEQKAMRTAKRLAIENDRIMDLLMDINESPQIPFERRIDLNMDEDEDDNDSDATQKPTRSLRKLEQDVPHQSFAATAEQFPEILEDLEPEDPVVNPTSFLNADDIDEYIYEIDTRLKLPTKPSLAPSIVGKEITNPAANFALRNPTSVYNWLRRHAPKTFLQDLEKEKGGDKDKGKDKDDGHGDKDDDHRKRKSTGGNRNKRQSAASRKEKEREAAEPMDWDEDPGYDAPAPKGKRKRDDDSGYRPKGGSSRPTKKRKSKDFGSLPSKGSRKSGA
ncbi:IEC3 subunit of the Ino80 complex, chromatin re-modelling-domain-containing protein [Hypoxylon trugodes]|uniref:IEC3 subunit of the Ino80 complex, chromatin re-modelling-domain-containing protein n=1 Tax=Hypoxylon trugodes TaxID=326681 RepID=UPI0021953546|nr:IEC3 subunit of the Ino80 complex, chromatin re-modelling-domain-containing protein [Hypoxylon trugodes]KAI1389523.1 IEC3 subunit of the Ino80 complex, chromatin re-modelling-domain-containing protein [Hypoxylon trugodes]